MPLATLAYKVTPLPFNFLSDHLQELLNEQRSRLQAYAYAILKNIQDAEDIVQNVYLIALKKDDLLHHNNPMGWLLKTTRFEALNHYRKNKKVKVGLDPEVMTLLEETASTNKPPSNPMSEKIKWCLSQLKEKYQNLFRWRYEDNLKGEELAQKCGLKKEAMYKALSRYQSILKKCLERPDHG